MTHFAPQFARAIRVAAALLALAGPWRAAMAHTRLLHTQPAAGAHVSMAPAQLLLVFSRKLVLESSQVEVFGPGMRPVALAALRLDAKDSRQLIVPITGGKPAGVYTVRWRVTGGDGHPVRGTYTFIVDRSTATAAAVGHAVLARFGSSSTFENWENCSDNHIQEWLVGACGADPGSSAGDRAAVRAARFGPGAGASLRVGDGGALRRRIDL